MSRHAERASRPGRLKRRRRSVLVVRTPAPRPRRAVQRARLWASTWTASQAPFAPNFPDGRWLRPMRRLAGLGALVESIAFSPDGERLVAGDADGVVAVWAVEDGRALDRS